MFDDSLALLDERLADSAKVLDVGGWARPLSRADWVIDLMPYETRGMLGWDGDRAQERFSSETWVTRDLCDRDPWPFEDGRFDFAVCSHTLEDLRDPVWACGELQRVARAGYVEVPSRLEEQSFGVQGSWVGWGHHHWLIDVDRAGLSFVFKPHLLGALPGSAFEPGFAQALPPTDRVSILWWEGSFRYGERLVYEPEELNAYLTGFVAENRDRVPESRLEGGGERPSAGGDERRLAVAAGRILRTLRRGAARGR